MTHLTWFKSSYSSDEGGACLEVAYDWHKSSYSTEEGGNCLEVAYTWRKSSHSGDEGGACVEVAAHPTTIHVRDSKDPGARTSTSRRVPGPRSPRTPHVTLPPQRPRNRGYSAASRGGSIHIRSAQRVIRSRLPASSRATTACLPG